MKKLLLHNGEYSVLSEDLEWFLDFYVGDRMGKSEAMDFLKRIDTNMEMGYLDCSEEEAVNILGSTLDTGNQTLFRFYKIELEDNDFDLLKKHINHIYNESRGTYLLDHFNKCHDTLVNKINIL